MIPPMPRSAYSTFLIALAAFTASAGTVAVPAAPVSPYADTEAVTNAAVRSSLGQFSVGEYLDNVIDHSSSVTNVPMAEVSTNCCGVGKTPVIGSIKALE